MADTVKHTEGPWSFQYTDESGECFVIAQNLGGLVGAALPWPTEIDSRDFRRVISNARLIAAAPDLLDAAEKTVDGLAEEYLITADCDDDWIYDTLGSVLAGVYFSARSAIAKAEGRS